MNGTIKCRRKRLGRSFVENAEVIIEIHDLSGKSVLKLFKENLTSGQYSYDFETSALLPGTYTLTIKVNGKLYANKMLKSGM